MSKTANETTEKKPSWSDIKKAIAGYDRLALVGLISDLYASSAQNRPSCMLDSRQETMRASLS